MLKKFWALVKYLSLLCFFSAIFYFENIQIAGGLKVSQVWKIPLILFLIGYLVRKSVQRRFATTTLAYWMALKNLINEGLFLNALTNIIESARFLSFPLLCDFFYRYFKESGLALRVLVRVAQYFILSSIPFLLGILESFKEGMEFGDEASYIGVFQNSHGASMVTSLSVIVLLFYLKEYRLDFLSKAYNIALVALGGYCVYLAFIRTGYLMLAVGVLFVFWPKKLSFQSVLAFIVVVAVGFIGSVLLVETNDAFRARIFDENSSGEQLEAGSGRLKFAQYSLEFWGEGDFSQIMLGRGLDEVKANLKRRVGWEIFSHNGFVDALAANGVVGLTLMLLFIFFFYREVRKAKRAKSYRLALATLFIYISYQATQGGTGFPIDIIVGLILTTLRKEYELSQRS